MNHNDFTDEEIAAPEVLERIAGIAERRLKSRTAYNNPDITRLHLQAMLVGLEHEVFGAIFLDSQHRQLATDIIFRGTIDGASVYPREVVKATLKHNAAAVIFFHNHPSGEAEPSTADRQITRRLNDALSLLDIRVLDHIVVGHGNCVSFAERGLI